MEKINLNQEWSFGDSITLTFSFLKQEIKPLLKALCILVLPLLLAEALLEVTVVRSAEEIFSFSINSRYATTDVGRSLVTFFFNCLLYFWMALFGFGYIRVYLDKYRQGDETSPKASEVGRVMLRNSGNMLLGGIVCFLLVVLGSMFFVLPGIYLLVALSFTGCFIFFQRKTAFQGISGSMSLTQGRWWELFGYVILLHFIVLALSLIFSIPQFILIAKAAATQEVPNRLLSSFALTLGRVGEFVLQIITVTGISVRFFSFWEKKEHETLLGKIDRIGEEIKS